MTNLVLLNDPQYDSYTSDDESISYYDSESYNRSKKRMKKKKFEAKNWSSRNLRKMKNQSRKKLQQLKKNSQEYMARKFVKISKRKSFKRRREPKAYYFHESCWKDVDNNYIEWLLSCADFQYYSDWCIGILMNPFDDEPALKIKRIYKKKKNKVRRKEESSDFEERSDNLKETVEISNLVNDLPDEIWERIFTNVSRDDLDLCTCMCRKWHRVIEGGSEQLTQRRVIYGLDFCRDLNARFWLEVTSQRRITIRVEDCSTRQSYGFYVFKNSILERMNSALSTDFCVDRLEAYLKKLCDWGGERIPVKSFKLDFYPRYTEKLERFHHFFPYYVNAEELVICIDNVMLNKKCWKCLDFGPTTAVNIVISHYPYIGEFDYLVRLADFHRDVPNFKEFVSGNFLVSPNLKKLELSHECNGICFISIVEAFFETTEPSKFFKEINIHRCGFSEFDRIAEENGFEPVRQVLLKISSHERHKINVHRLDHPKLKWALEATMKLRWALDTPRAVPDWPYWRKIQYFGTHNIYWRSRYNTLKLKIMEID